jgi:hypothetical protein
VLSLMRAALDETQIFDSVVCSVAVDVVDVLLPREESLKVLFHHVPMLIDVAVALPLPERVAGAIHKDVGSISDPRCPLTKIRPLDRRTGCHGQILYPRAGTAVDNGTGCTS